MFLFLDIACLATRGVKRARVESAEPSVRVIYNNLTRLNTSFFFSFPNNIYDSTLHMLFNLSFCKILNSILSAIVYFLNNPGKVKGGSWN
jgi:hypothetical protein